MIVSKRHPLRNTSRGSEDGESAKGRKACTNIPFRIGRERDWQKVFRLTLGSIDRFAVAESIEDMHDRRAEIEPTFAYTPVEIQELHIPGYVIEAHAIPKEEPKPVETIVKEENWMENATKQS